MIVENIGFDVGYENVDYGLTAADCPARAGRGLSGEQMALVLVCSEIVKGPSR